MLNKLSMPCRLAAIAVIVAAGAENARAQFSQGPGLSSGSGSGTGSGGFSGLRGNYTGSISGVGPGQFGPGTIIRGEPVVPLPGVESRRRMVGFGPGVDVTFPNDPYLVPFMTMETPQGAPIDRATVVVTKELLNHAREIATPGERSLALQRLANGAIIGQQFNLAHHTLEEAAKAANEVDIELMRDQRLIAIVTSLNYLAERLIKPLSTDVRVDDVAAAPPAPAAEAVAPDAIPKGQKADRDVQIRMSRLEWNRGVYLASAISNPTYRNEMLYHVAWSMAKGSSTLAVEGGKLADTGPPPKPEPATLGGNPPAKDKEAAQKSQQTATKLKQTGDTLLVDAWKVSETIERLIWRFRAMVQITLEIADSDQYPRAIELAKRIQNAEARAEALLVLAEAESRHHLYADSSDTYNQAAQAVACVTQEGLRGVLAGILVDSLIATGRFTDARACIGLFPEMSQRLVALGAIAESQGVRGQAAIARKWIVAEVPEQYRPPLNRRVILGSLKAMEQNPGRDQESQTNPIFRLPLP
jgi:hypothetical protein